MIEVRAQRQPWRDGVEIMVLDTRAGKVAAAQPLVFTVIEDLAQIHEPTMTLSNSQAQQLMDELWRCGLRPTDGSGSAGSLAATERHLQDMRAMAMGLLKKDGVSL